MQPVVLAYGRRPRAPQLSWETIEAPRHIFLVLSTLFATAHIVELPMYHPSGEERADPALYARNVRRYMVRATPLATRGVQFRACIACTDFQGVGTSRWVPPPFPGATTLGCQRLQLGRRAAVVCVAARA